MAEAGASDGGELAGGELIIGDAAALLQELPIEAGKVRAHRLHRSPAVTIMGVAMDAGSVMREHQAPVPILVQVVDGHAEMDLSGQVVDLPVGSILRVEARVLHEVRALTETRFLLLLLGTAG